MSQGPITLVSHLREAAKKLRWHGSLALRALRLVWESSRLWTASWGAILVVRGLLPGAIVYVTKWVVDAVAAAVGGGLSMENVMSAVWPAVVMGGLLISQQVLQRLINWIQVAQSELVQDKIKSLIHQKAVSVDYGFYESPEYFDLLQEADSQASSRSLGLLQNVGGIAQNSITFVSIAAIMATYSLWLPVILLVGTVPAIYIVVHYNREYHRWWEQTTKDRRWAYYLNVLFIEPRFAAEMRLYDLGDYLEEEYKKVRRRLRDERINLTRKQTFAGIFAALQGILITGGIMAWMVWRALQGAATLGDLALFYQAINKGQSLVRTLLGSVGDIYTNTLFVEHLFKLLEIEPRQTEPEAPRPVPVPLSDGITFENVSFQYPGGESFALRDLDLHIPAGQIVAVVGPNGAGKSTLTKLLCRFYDPVGGSVSIDGVDLRQLSKKELRSHISIMFQTPVRYQATARENIALSRKSASLDDLKDAAQGARAHEFIQNLPNQYDTLLGRLFPGGTELSGGQWQRIALSRAFLRRSPIVVLDEPTSSMDSWAEQEWLRQFRELVDGRTALIVTHRFTTAMQADVIHVMSEGKVVESGTHEELLAKGGRYAQSWRAQVRQGPGLVSNQSGSENGFPAAMSGGIPDGSS